jgi:hypothetical protein
VSTTVPESRNDLVLAAGGQDTTAATRTVRSVTWVDAARLQCWLAGRGSMDVPAHAIPGEIVDDEGGESYYYRTKPRFQTTRYVYSFVLTTPELRGFNAEVEVPVGGTAYVVPVVRRDNPVREPFSIVVDRASKSDAEVELSFHIDPLGRGNVSIESVSIEAVPRAVLSVTGNDLGADRLAFWTRQGITAPGIVDQVLARQDALRDSARRTGLFQYSRGTTAPWSITSGTFVDLFDSAVPIVGRRVYAAGNPPARVRVLVRCSDGSTAGEVRFASAADDKTIAIPTGTTAWTWLPATSGDGLAMAVSTEDPAQPTGLIDNTWDDHMTTISARRTAGTGQVQIASISVFDAA